MASYGYYANGGNGGKGGLSQGTISVSPGNQISLTVGSGGQKGRTGTAHKFYTYGNNGSAGGKSSCGSIVANGGGGGSRGSTGNDDDGWIINHGSNGTSYGNGGNGGLGDICTGSCGREDSDWNKVTRYATTGSNGWVYIEYGGDI